MLDNLKEKADRIQKMDMLKRERLNNPHLLQRSGTQFVLDRMKGAVWSLLRSHPHSRFRQIWTAISFAVIIKSLILLPILLTACPIGKN